MFYIEKGFDDEIIDLVLQNRVIQAFDYAEIEKLSQSRIHKRMQAIKHFNPEIKMSFKLKNLDEKALETMKDVRSGLESKWIKHYTAISCENGENLPYVEPNPQNIF